jgi:putative membrane protein
MASNRPRAFRLSDAEFAPVSSVEPPRGPRAVTVSPDTTLEALLEGDAGAPAAPPLDTSARSRWPVSMGGLLLSALGGLALIAISTAIERYVASLLEENGWLGGVALALAAVAALALLALVVREAAAILRQRRIAHLRQRAVQLASGRDVGGAAKLVAELAAIYARRPETARARALLASLDRDVLDPADRIGIAERELILPLDQEARRLVAASAQRVSIVTTLAPRAVFDVLFVAGQSLWLIRRVSEVYGSRPGVIEFLAITRRVLAHLAITGGMAIGDSLVQQVLGHGIASRLSAKLGEGVLNGLLNARVGLATIEACRPLPFAAVAAPRLVDVAGALMRRGTKESSTKGKIVASGGQ